MNAHKTSLAFTLLILASLLANNTAHARDYLIEIVLFENLAGRKATTGGVYYPKLGKSVRLNTEAAVAAGFVPVESGLTLSDNAAAIAGSRQYRLLRHMAWRQPGLDKKNALPVRISLGNTTDVYIPEDLGDYDEFIPASVRQSATNTRQIKTSTLTGTIEIELGRFLHMNALLVYTDADSQQSFKLSQHRKMRSRELHYIDNPRFGILTRILPIEEEESVPAQEQEQPAEPLQESEADPEESTTTQ